MRNYHGGMAGPLYLDVDGRQVPITNPDKVVFPDIGVTKMDLILYYLDVAEGALRGVAGRPMMLKRFVKGITEEAVFQKRAPEKRPDFVDVAELKYASGTSAKEAVIYDAAGLVWAVNLGCVDFNPHPVRADDLLHPDELRVDLDPMPGVTWRQIVRRRACRPRGARGSRTHRVAEDIRIARLPHLCADRTTLAVQAGSAGRSDAGPRGGAPGPGTGDGPLVEGGARGRLRRLQPERLRPHGRFGLLGAGHAGCPGVHAAVLG